MSRGRALPERPSRRVLGGLSAGLLAGLAAGWLAGLVRVRER